MAQLKLKNYKISGKECAGLCSFTMLLVISWIAEERNEDLGPNQTEIHKEWCQENTIFTEISPVLEQLKEEACGSIRERAYICWFHHRPT